MTTKSTAFYIWIVTLIGKSKIFNLPNFCWFGTKSIFLQETVPTYSRVSTQRNALRQVIKTCLFFKSHHFHQFFSFHSHFILKSMIELKDRIRYHHILPYNSEQYRAITIDHFQFLDRSVTIFYYK